MRFHCTALLAVLLSAAPVAAQQNLPTPATGEATFNILFKGIQVGREQVTLSRGSAGWIITSSGTSGPPINLNIRRFEMKYTDDWQPLELKIEAVLRNAGIALATSFSMTTAINEVSQNGTTNSKEDQITARTVVLPNNFYASYEALAVHLAASQVDAEIPVYVAPQAEIRVKVRAITTQALAGPTGTMDIRRYDLTFNNPGTPLDGSVSIDNRSRFVRLELPSAGLTVVRDDASSVALRATISRNPTDVDVTFPPTDSTSPARSPRRRRLPIGCALQRSCWLAARDRPTAMKPSSAFRSSPSSRRPSPTTASSSCATTSAGSARAGAGPRPPRSRITPTMWSRQSDG